MAVTVEQDRARSRVKRKTRYARGREFLEEDAGPGDGLRFATSLAPQEGGGVLAHRRQAAWLAEHDWTSGLGVREQRVSVSSGHLTRGCQEALRDLRPAAALVVRHDDPQSCGGQHVE